MTLRSLISFDHFLTSTVYNVTPVTTYASANTLSTPVGVPGAIVQYASGAPPASINAYPGWLALPSSGTTAFTGYVISFADAGILQNGVTQAWFGFRTCVNGLISNTTATVGLSASGALAGMTALINETQMARPGTGSGNAQYVEVFVDIGNNVFKVYVNGVLNQSGSIPTGMQYVILSGQYFNSSYAQFFRDIYFLDVDATTPNSRLGPITSAALTMNAATAPNYTSSDSKTPLADLITAFGAAPAITPNITNAATNDPLTVSYTPTAVPGQKVVAMQYKLAAQVQLSMKLQPALVEGSNTTTLPAYTFADTQPYYGRDLAGLQQLAPDGDPWSATSIAATNLVLTPQTST